MVRILITVLSRVFKYANKGYGIRILPSYLESLEKVNPNKLPKEEFTGSWKDEDVMDYEKQFSLEARIASAREYFERVFQVYMSWSHNGRDLQPSYICGAWNGTSLRPTGQGVPVFTHALLDTRDQLTSQPQPRSCLTGFELLYRLAIATLRFPYLSQSKARGPLGSRTSRAADYTRRRMGKFFREWCPHYFSFISFIKI